MAFATLAEQLKQFIEQIRRSDNGRTRIVSKALALRNPCAPT